MTQPGAIQSDGATLPAAAPVAVQHKLDLSYAIPGTEQQHAVSALSSAPSTTAAAAPTAAAAGAAATAPAAAAGSSNLATVEAPGSAASASTATTLMLAANHHCKVDEAFVRKLAAAHAAFPITLSACSRSVQPADTSTAASTPAAKPPAAAKGAKAPAAPPEQPWSDAATCTLTVDLAPLLVGDTSVTVSWPQKGRQTPLELAAYEQLILNVEVGVMHLLGAVTQHSLHLQSNLG